jgi:hypothetical protein
VVNGIRIALDPSDVLRRQTTSGVAVLDRCVCVSLMMGANDVLELEVEEVSADEEGDDGDEALDAEGEGLSAE